MVKNMNKDVIVFVLRNHIPDIIPEDGFDGDERILNAKDQIFQTK